MAEENYCLYADARDTLERCFRLGYRNYLLTNNYPGIVETVQKLGIGDSFLAFVVSSHVGYNKPCKELFAYVKKLARASEICRMIGDADYWVSWGGRNSKPFGLRQAERLVFSVIYVRIILNFMIERQ